MLQKVYTKTSRRLRRRGKVLLKNRKVYKKTIQPGGLGRPCLPSAAGSPPGKNLGGYFEVKKPALRGDFYKGKYKWYFFTKGNTKGIFYKGK